MGAHLRYPSGDRMGHKGFAVAGLQKRKDNENRESSCCLLQRVLV